MSYLFCFMETIAFTFLCTLIRSNVHNNQIIIIIILVIMYIIIFRECNNCNKLQSS